VNRIRLMAWGLALLLPIAAAASEGVDAAASKPSLAGIWEGKLTIGANSLRIVFHITAGEDGAYTAKLDSPDQGAKSIPVQSVKWVDDDVVITVPVISGMYRGHPTEGAAHLEGNWVQSGKQLPLRLSRVDAPSKRSRPQHPKPPYPYIADEVTYQNEAAGVTLRGTLTMPKNGGPFPAVLLITGSGPQDRDETILEHKPFLVIADHLTRAGFAVLRVDDRGVGGSTKDDNPEDDTSADFAGDVRAGLKYLRGRDGIDARRVGLLGHSEGGLIAPLVAADNPDVAFIILLAGPGVPGDELLYVQSRLIAEAMGTPPEQIQQNLELQKEIFAIIRSEPDPAAAEEKAKDALRKRYASMTPEQQKESGDVEQFAAQHARVARSGWFRFFLTCDPRPLLQKVRCPVLAITGEKDLQVDPKQNMPEIEKALRAGGNTDVTLRIMPNANHLLQTCKTGAFAEYGEIEETIQPAVLEEIATWLKRVTQK
jgi:pimeloyl-ACP methyl ester carboxylesterase